MDVKKTNAKSLALWFILVLFVVALFSIYQGSFKKEHVSLGLSDFISAVRRGEIREVWIRDQELQALDPQEKPFFVVLPSYYVNEIIPLLEKNNVKFKVLPPESSFGFVVLVHFLFPLLLYGAVWFFFFRQVQNGGGRALGFGRSRAKLADPEKTLVTFEDIQGVDEAKADLREVVEFLRDAGRFRHIGGLIPKGILLIGPPGTGKTLLARAVAGEAEVPFFSISGSDFVEMFVGVGASRVRDLFMQAKQHAPCIVFIDEIDAVGRNRGLGLGGGHDEREQTLNQLLVEMDGFDPKAEVIVIAATNRSDVLDPALLRPGRFDRRISVDLPDLKGREAILQVHVKKIRLASGVSMRTVARGTPGFSGADLANLVNEAALLAARLEKDVVEQNDFEFSRDKIIMGPERRSLLLTDEERNVVAYHEAGHAVVAFHSSHSDPIHKATIIPRGGGSLGMVVRFPEGDRVSMSRQRLMDDLAVAMGGRVSEEMVFGKERVTTGASCDFQFATKIARKMVLEWGMSDVIGPIYYRNEESEVPVFLGGHGVEHSQTLMALLDQEVKKIMDQAYAQACHILSTHRDHLDYVAKSLLERETLTGDDIRDLLVHGSLPKPMKVASGKTSGKLVRVAARRKKKEEVIPVLLTPQEEM